MYQSIVLIQDDTRYLELVTLKIDIWNQIAHIMNVLNIIIPFFWQTVLHISILFIADIIQRYPPSFIRLLFLPSLILVDRFGVWLNLSIHPWDCHRTKNNVSNTLIRRFYSPSQLQKMAKVLLAYHFRNERNEQIITNPVNYRQDVRFVHTFFSVTLILRISTLLLRFLKFKCK